MIKDKRTGNPATRDEFVENHLYMETYMVSGSVEQLEHRVKALSEIVSYLLQMMMKQDMISEKEVVRLFGHDDYKVTKK